MVFFLLPKSYCKITALLLTGKILLQLVFSTTSCKNVLWLFFQRAVIFEESKALPYLAKRTALIHTFLLDIFYGGFRCQV